MSGKQIGYMILALIFLGLIVQNAPLLIHGIRLTELPSNLIRSIYTEKPA